MPSERARPRRTGCARRRHRPTAHRASPAPRARAPITQTRRPPSASCRSSASGRHLDRAVNENRVDRAHCRQNPRRAAPRRPHPGGAGGGQARPAAAASVLVGFERRHLRPELVEDGGGIAAAAGHIEHLLAGLDLEGLDHTGEDHRREHEAPLGAVADRGYPGRYRQGLRGRGARKAPAERVSMASRSGMSFTSKVRSWLSTIVRRACAKSTMEVPQEVIGGLARNRTGVQGFAVLCVTTPPRGHPGRAANAAAAP